MTGRAVHSFAMTIVNFVLFQAAWFACVVLAARGRPGLGVACVALVCLIHVALADRRIAELELMGIVIAVGVIWDSAVLATGWVSYPSGLFAPPLAPNWIIAMWALFATLLNRSLRWLHGRVALAALFGLIGGPLAYYGGVRLGAVQFVQPRNVMLLQGLGWAALTPLLLWLAKKLDV